MDGGKRITAEQFEIIKGGALEQQIDVLKIEIREQFADQLKTRLKLYQFEMEERGLPAQTIHIEGVLRIIDRTLYSDDIIIEDLP